LSFEKKFGKLGGMEAHELRAWREARSLTQPQLGELLDARWETVSRWERGVRPIPRVVELALRTIERELPTIAT